ncbi:MAG: hypothetical protein HY908_17015 [Myxococcales bacterium]|nr:hypothetical protein [Myxococcales bacterium]
MARNAGLVALVGGVGALAALGCTSPDSGGGTGGAGATTSTGGMTSTTSTTSTHTGGSGAYVEGSLPADSGIMYLHHSTGGVIWGGGVPEGVDAANTANGTSYAIEQTDYPSAAYPWQNYPYDYWHLWVEAGGQAAAEGQQSLADLTAAHRVVVFKHCFPVSDIEADTGSPDLASEVKSIENYELQYAALKDALHAYPQTRFLVWTGAARLLTESSVEQGARSRQFFTWVKETWDEPGDNIFVWDFFELETEGGDFLVPAYAAGDSHPSDAFALQVAPFFVNRLLAVLDGSADGGSLTGQ